MIHCVAVLHGTFLRATERPMVAYPSAMVIRGAGQCAATLCAAVSPLQSHQASLTSYAPVNYAPV